MLEIVDEPISGALDEIVVAALSTLYGGIAGAEALSVRAYRDVDAMLVLLRFDPSALRIRSDDGYQPLVEVSMLALPDLVAQTVLERTGQQLLPGSVSVSAGRGLAVFGFSVRDADAPLVVELIGLDGGLRPTG